MNTEDIVRVWQGMCILCRGRGETWVDLRGTVGTCPRCEGTGVDPNPVQAEQMLNK